MSEPEETAAIERVRRGDLDAFETLMRLHVRRLRMLIGLRAPVPDLVDEVVQQTFVFAFEHIDEFRKGTHFFAWLSAIAKNHLRTEILRYSRDRAGRMKYAEQRLLQIAQDRFARRAPQELIHLEVCLERVPANLRELLELTYKQQHSASEIAQRLEQSLSWVYTTLCRVRKQLRKCIETKLALEQT